MNKKVLLREHKRHTARRVSSTPLMVLTDGLGYSLQSWPGRVPIPLIFLLSVCRKSCSNFGTVVLSLAVADQYVSLNPSSSPGQGGYPHPVLARESTLIQSWPGRVPSSSPGQGEYPHPVLAREGTLIQSWPGRVPSSSSGRGNPPISPMGVPLSAGWQPLLAIIALSAIQSSPRLLIHNAILFINTSTMHGTREVIG